MIWFLFLCFSFLFTYLFVKGSAAKGAEGGQGAGPEAPQRLAGAANRARIVIVIVIIFIFIVIIIIIYSIIVIVNVMFAI